MTDRPAGLSRTQHPFRPVSAVRAAPGWVAQVAGRYGTFLVTAVAGGRLFLRRRGYPGAPEFSVPASESGLAAWPGAAAGSTRPGTRAERRLNGQRPRPPELEP